MGMNQAKIAAAAKVTDTVIAGFNEASRQLECCWTNGAGVLSDPSQTSNRLYDAKVAIEKALAAMRGFSWPTDADYGE